MRGSSARELALVLVSLAGTLALFELAARGFLDPPRYHRRSPFLEFDATLGHRGVPRYRDEVSSAEGVFPFELNEQGFRDRALPRPAVPPDALRIVFVGDSFLVGRTLPAERLLTSVVGTALARRGIDAEVYNLSVVDYGTLQELLLLDRWGPRLRPDVVVLALYPGNDVVNNAIGLAGRTRVSPGDPIRPYRSPDPGSLDTRFVAPFRAWLRRHSLLFATLERPLLAPGALWGREREPMSVAARLRQGRAPREELELFRSHDPGHPWEVAWRETESLLRLLAERCEGLGARLLVLVIPTHDQVVRTPGSIDLEIRARRADLDSLAGLVDWNLPERRLAAFFRREGIPAILLLTPLRAAARSAADVYTMDGHLGASGHRVAAELVIPFLAGDAVGSVESDLAERAPSGFPTRRLPDAAHGGTLLDFRSADHRDHLGGGWIFWHPQRDGEPWGWWTGPRVELVLRAAPGPLVLRGWLPPEASLPVTVRLRRPGSGEATIERAGEFALRFSPDVSESITSSEGYVFLRFDVGETHRLRDMPIGMIVHGVGFEGARAPEGA